MKQKNVPCMKAPCKNCPFRKDSLKGWLGEDRMKEICRADSFVCHKKPDLQCAGHMILLEGNNSFFRLYLRLGVRLDLQGRSLIFDSVLDCVTHHT